MVNGIPHLRLKADSLSIERLEGEAIVIDFETGRYFSLRGSGADILWLLQHNVSTTTWASVLEDHFPGLSVDSAVASDITGFLSDLQRSGLVEPADTLGGPVVDLPDDYVRGPWVAPRILANDELADLLVIDPVHDASEDGWPEARPS